MIGNWNYGTGRRKSSVARVFMKKGSGQILVNGKPVEEYFGRQTSIMVVRQPLLLTANDATFDVKVNVHGGGETGQAGRGQHKMARCLPQVGQQRENGTQDREHCAFTAGSDRQNRYRRLLPFSVRGAPPGA